MLAFVRRNSYSFSLSAEFYRSPLDVLTFEQPAWSASSFRFFPDGAVCFQKFLGGEFLSCAGLLESKHISTFLLFP